MSKSFTKNIDSYQVGRYKLMSIELDRVNLARYRHLSDNPVYFYNCLTFCGGSLYRAILGYEVLWDRRKEEELMLCLDYFLTTQQDRNLYYTEELKVTRDFRTHGVAWPRGIAPRTLRFDLQWAYEIKAGESLTARINMLDKPYHVDIERGNGEVFSLQLPRYHQLLERFCKPKGNRNETDRNKRRANQTSKGFKGSGLSLVRGFSNKESPFEVPRKVFNLRQRIRR